MIVPPNNFGLLFIVAGLVMISVFFLTSSPLDITNIILGAVPLIFFLTTGFFIWKAKRGSNTEDEER